MPPPHEIPMKLEVPHITDGASQLIMSEAIDSSPESDELNEFRDIFDKKMPSSNKPITHESTSVLLLSFDSKEKDFNDLPKLCEEVDKLEDVFREQYGFFVERKVIKSDRSAQIQMNRHLSSFADERNGNHALLIVYYAGHGWHSKHRTGFNLYPKKLRHGEDPAGYYSNIMWERSEANLHDVTCDVLVIFDCCDAGSLAHLRSPGRAFEYLGACKEGKYTHRPGENSFTSALTWALKKLASGPPFTTTTLRNTIEQYKYFPRDQQPVLFPRYDWNPENIWISSMRDNVSPFSEGRRFSTSMEFREEDCEYIDFRIFFNKPLTKEEAENVARMMSPLVTDKHLPLNARHVSIINKSTCQPRRSPIARWTTVKNVMRLAYRWGRPSELEQATKESSSRKRQREARDDDADDPPPIYETSKGSPTSVTGASKETELKADVRLQLPLQAVVQSAPPTFRPIKRVRTDSVMLSGDAVARLEDLEQSAARILREIREEKK